MSSSLLFLTRLLLYPGALLACDRDFFSVSPQSCLVGLFFFFHIAIGRSFLPIWQRCNGGGSPCSLPSQMPYSEGILVAVREAWYYFLFLIKHRLLRFLPPSCRLYDRTRLVFLVLTLPVACWLSWPLGSRLNFCDP